MNDQVNPMLVTVAAILMIAVGIVYVVQLSVEEMPGRYDAGYMQAVLSQPLH